MASDHQVSHYNKPPRTEAPVTPLSEAVVQLFAQGSAAAGVAAPIPDGRLYQALAELAEIAPLDTPLAYSVIEFAMQRNGIIEPSPHLVIIQGDMNDLGPILDELSPSVAEILASGSYERIGIGAARRGEVDMILLALQESNVTTRPIVRELAVGGSTAIEGVLGAGFTEPHAFHTDDAGKVHKMSVARIGGDGFRTLFSCGDHNGRQQVELTASDKTGSTVLANFPVWCGIAAPRTMRVTTHASDPPPKTREEAEERMLVLINSDRAEHKLPPLALDRRLTGIARLHSDEMLRTGDVSHVSPTTGSAGDRVEAGGVRTAVILENVARAYGVAEAELGLMNSPGHRANLLSDEVSHVGVGITLGKDVAGRRELLVTQVFIHIPKPIRAEEVRSKVVAKIRSIKPMTASFELRQVAQAFATEIANGVATEEASKHASKSLDTAARGFARVSTLVTTVANVRAFDPSGSLGSAKVSHHGIGIAQGDHPVMGEGAIYIVVLLGQK
ncbi:MAG: hypothetical protein GY811_20570 [Myxococcales bacterium]|nr:hypothetical protein [Myxococcales bacterium]